MKALEMGEVLHEYFSSIFIDKDMDAGELSKIKGDIFKESSHNRSGGSLKTKVINCWGASAE